MRCDTCKEDSPVVMRVVIAEHYNRVLARAIFNCPDCFSKKEAAKPYAAAQQSKTTQQNKTTQPSKPDTTKRS